MSTSKAASNLHAIMVFMTASSAEEAARLADMLVQTRLAACVQVLQDIQSIYRWQGNIERSSEVLLIAKTDQSKFAALEQQVRAMHSYETPEIVAIPAAEVSGPYGKWLSDSLQPENG